MKNQSLRVLLLGLSGLGVGSHAQTVDLDGLTFKSAQFTFSPIKNVHVSNAAIKSVEINQLDAQIKIEAVLESLRDSERDDLHRFIKAVRSDDHLRRKVFQAFDLLVNDSEIRKLQAFRDLSQPVSFEESVEFLGKLLRSRDIEFSAEEVKSLAKTALVAGEAAEMSGFDVLQDRLSIGAVNRGDAMCQSCGATTALVQPEILERLRNTL